MSSSLPIEKLATFLQKRNNALVVQVASRDEVTLSLEHTAVVRSYLLCPHEVGIWEMRADWNCDSKIAAYIFEKAGTFEVFDEDPDAPSRPIHTLLASLSEKQQEDLLVVALRLSPINTLFAYFNKAFDPKKKTREVQSIEWLAKIEADDFIEEFNEAVAIFDNEIFCNTFSPRVGEHSAAMSTLHGPIYVIEPPREEGKLIITSPCHKAIDAITRFYCSIGVIKNVRLHRLFAPDERLLKPYFYMFSSIFSKVITDNDATRSFHQALEYYKDKDYKHCVSTLGLIGEDYLTRIYTTLLRQQCSPGLTLGQLFDEIHKDISSLLQPTKPTLKNVDDLFAKINELTLESGVAKQQTLLRGLIETIKEDRKFFSSRIDDIAKTQAKISPFPARIKENLAELLKFRNAASHNTRVPLGAYEADRSLYCLVSVVSWWQTTMNEVDWNLSKLDVIRELIAQAKK